MENNNGKKNNHIFQAIDLDRLRQENVKRETESLLIIAKKHCLMLINKT